MEELQKEEIHGILKEYHGSPQSLMEALKKVQDHYGYINIEIQNQVAEELKLPLKDVTGVSSFYTFFHEEKYGKYVLRVCKSAPCHIGRSAETLERLKDVLGIDVGETTEDGMFTLLTCSCLGACDKAPAVLVNDRLCGPVKPETVPEFLEKLRVEGQV